MKRLNLIVTAIFLFGAWLSNAQTQPEIWKNDPPHSQLYFTVTHLGFNKISGTFDDTVIEVTATEADFSDARFEVTAQTNSINTLVEARNNHLKSADFFDIETYPTLTFTSTNLKKKGKNKYKLTGDLTMHGVTKPVTLDLIYQGETVNPMSSKQTIAFKATGTLKRSDYAIGGSFPEAIISDEVHIEFNGEFVQ